MRLFMDKEIRVSKKTVEIATTSMHMHVED